MFHLDVNRVPLHQASDLDAYTTGSSLAFLFVQTKQGRWLLPWANVRELYWNNGGSMDKAFLDAKGIKVRQFDWLEVVS